MNYEAVAEFGELGICGLWSNWKPLWLIFESLIHGSAFSQNLLLESCVHCINEYFIFRCGSLPREPVGRWSSELYLAQFTSAESVISKEYQE